MKGRKIYKLIYKNLRKSNAGGNEKITAIEIQINSRKDQGLLYSIEHQKDEDIIYVKVNYCGGKNIIKAQEGNVRPLKGKAKTERKEKSQNNQQCIQEKKQGKATYK